MGIFLKEMVLDLPGIIVTEPVSDFDLRQRVLIELPFVVHAPWARQLQFIKNAEFHGWFPVWRWVRAEPDCASGRKPCQERCGRAASGWGAITRSTTNRARRF